MAGIKSIYRSPDAFRFPTWETVVSYPVNSVVAYYDSDGLGRWRHYISLTQTSPGSLDSDIKLDEWIEMSFDSEQLYNLTYKAAIETQPALLAYLEPRLDSDLSVKVDSDFKQYGDNLKQKIDSDVNVSITTLVAEESDRRVIFETQVLTQVAAIDSDTRTLVDSDLSSMKVTIAAQDQLIATRLADQDSDLTVVTQKVDTNSTGLDSDINRLDARYTDLARFSVNNQIAINNLKANSDSDILAINAKLDVGFQTIAQHDSDRTITRKQIVDGDSDVRALIVATEATIRSEVNINNQSYLDADSDLKAALEAQIQSSSSSSDSELAAVKKSLDDVYEQYVRISNGNYVGDSDGATTNAIAFNKVSVAGQTDVDATSSNKSLTLVAGNNVSITTDAAAQSVTISSNVNQGLDFGTYDNPNGFTLDMQTF